jgi:hypothetical protein
VSEHSQAAGARRRREQAPDPAPDHQVASCKDHLAADRLRDLVTSLPQRRHEPRCLSRITRGNGALSAVEPGAGRRRNLEKTVGQRVELLQPAFSRRDVAEVNVRAQIAGIYGAHSLEPLARVEPGVTQNATPIEDQVPQLEGRLQVVGMTGHDLAVEALCLRRTTV